MTPLLDLSHLKASIRDIPNFPKEGILFRDITPVLQDAALFSSVIDAFAAELDKYEIDLIIGIESRGFIFSPALAYKMKKGFVPVRKKGKLPCETKQVSYSLEYGEAVLEIHRDALKSGTRVVIIDDLLATGGTAHAATQLVEELGGKVELLVFLVELAFLKGRENLGAREVFSLVKYGE